MHAGNSGVVASSLKPLDMVAKPTFKEKKFPTSVRMLYLKSSKDQNHVISIGYKYVSPTKVHYHLSKVRRDRPTGFQKQMGIEPCRDIFSRKLAYKIVTGRFKKYPGWSFEVKNKDELYNKFIMMYHPDRKERKEAKKRLFLDEFKVKAQEGFYKE